MFGGTPMQCLFSRAAIPVSAALLLMLGASAASGITVSTPTFYQIDFYGNQTATLLDTDWGDLEITVTPDGDPLDYVLNLVVRLNGASPSHWVIRNRMIPASGDIGSSMDLRNFFDLGLLGVTTGTPLAGLEYLLVLSTVPSTIAPVGVFTAAVVLGDNIDAEGFAEGGVGPATSPGSPPAADPVPAGNAQNRMKVYRDDVPHVEEGVNECGPGAITRSLRWLDDKNMIDLGGKTNAQLMQDLKTASNWGAASGIPTYADTLKAKLSVTKNLGVVNKFQVRRPSSVPNGNFATPDGVAFNRGNDPTFDFICNELKRDEDVEIVVGWMTGATRNNGHVMTVIGCDKDMANGKQEITVQDDKNQGSANLKAQKRTTRYTDAVGGNPPRLDDLPSNRVEMVVSESPAPVTPMLPLWTWFGGVTLLATAGGVVLRRR